MIALFDIDHTLSDAHVRDHLIKEAKEVGDFDIYHSQACNDAPIPSMCALARTLVKSGSWLCVGLTTREERWRTATTLWLSAHGIMLHELLMRSDQDKRPTPVVKLDLVKRRWPDPIYKSAFLLFDDRDIVTKAFRAEGYNVCLVSVGGMKTGEEGP